MKKLKTVLASLSLSATILLTAGVTVTYAEPMQKTIATNLLTQGLIKGDTGFIQKHVAENYIQHNPSAPDGRKGLLGFVAYLKALPTQVTIKPIRVLSQGNLVVVHSHYTLNGNKAVFDLFRFKEGKIVEHWDAIQAIPTQKSLNGNTMFDGPSKVKDLSKTQANKELVLGLVNDILINGKVAKITKYIGKTYIQHNPEIGNGLEGLGKYLSQLKAAKITFSYTKVHNVIAEGNFVFTQSQGKISGKPFAFYDLFRVENGKIIEHWDVVQPIPAKMAHNNGMF